MIEDVLQEPGDKGGCLEDSTTTSYHLGQKEDDQELEPDAGEKDSPSLHDGEFGAFEKHT